MEIRFFQDAVSERNQRLDLNQGYLMATIKNLMLSKDDLPLNALDFYPQYRDGLTYSDRQLKRRDQLAESQKAIDEMKKRVKRSD